MGGFRGGVCAVGGGGSEYSCFSFEESVDLGDGVADAVEEHDVVGGDLYAAVSLVDVLGEEGACFGDASGVAVSVGGGGVEEFVE